MTTVAAQPVRVALLGCGTVGAAVARAVLGRAPVYAARLGAAVELTGIAVRDAERERDLGPELGALLTDRSGDLVDGADVVIEVMGGIEPARSLVVRALSRGAHVVTANKQLIAHHGPELHLVADEHGTTLAYEAAVVAAVPVLRVVREALAGDKITAISGIVNGSTNFILDQVSRHGMPFQDALTRAGELGYLEADPTEDLEGIDAAAKIVILARAAWGVDVSLDDVQIEGITGLTDEDFEEARGTGQVIKLIASAWASGPPGNPRVELAVRPVRLGAGHPMAQAREGRNVVQIEAESAGMIRMIGEGAGGDATASAVLGDLITAAGRVVAARSGQGRHP